MNCHVNKKFGTTLCFGFGSNNFASLVKFILDKQNRKTTSIVLFVGDDFVGWLSLFREWSNVLIVRNIEQMKQMTLNGTMTNKTIIIQTSINLFGGCNKKWLHEMVGCTKLDGNTLYVNHTQNNIQLDKDLISEIDCWCFNTNYQYLHRDVNRYIGNTEPLCECNYDKILCCAWMKNGTKKWYTYNQTELDQPRSQKLKIPRFFCDLTIFTKQ